MLVSRQSPRSSLIFLPAASSAHPMGNFSISHYAGITIEDHFVEVRYFIDMAEIPTFQELQQSGLEARLDDPRLAAYLPEKARALAQALRLTINGHPVPLGCALDENADFSRRGGKGTFRR